MLVLSRKIGESIVIGNEVVIRVVRVSGTRASMAIEAPINIPVDRKEIRSARNRERRAARNCESVDTRVGAGKIRQDKSDCKVGGGSAFVGSYLVRRADPVLKRVTGKRKDELVKRDSHRRVLQPSSSPEGQTDRINLRAALACLIADSQACGGPEIEFIDDLVIDKLSPVFQRAVLSVVRELLLNACRHSKSKKALLGLAEDDGYLFLQVQDWGVGFDPANVQPHERGLREIQDMVGRLGGTVRIDSQRGMGTCVLVEVPLLQEPGPDSTARERKPR
jgi:carbon storage regulator CsrA